MAQPTAFTRQYNFNDFQTSSPGAPLPAVQLDNELNATKTNLDGLNANIAKIQRDDGLLANQSVHKNSFDVDALALIGLSGYTVSGDWAASVAYAAGTLVNFNDATYLATVAHTSVSAFATDKAAGKWILLANAAISTTGASVDKFEGTGSQTAFTLSLSYSSNTDMLVFVNGALRNPGDDYNVSGTTLTFSTAPSTPSVSGNENVIIWGANVATQAALSAANTASSNASGFAALAQDWAEKTSAPVTGSSYSAKYWATSTAVTNVSANVADITTVAGEISPTNNISTVASRDADIGTVAARDANIGTVAARDADIGTVAARDANIGVVAARDANIGTVAARDANIGTVAARDADIGVLAGISSDVTTLANALSSTTTYAVTVASVSGSNVFVLDGSNNPAIQLDRGNTYIFDQSDASNSGHTLAFKNGSSSYTTGVTTTGTAGQAGAKTTIIVDAAAPSSGLLYYCVAHGNAMGNAITTVTSNFAVVASNMGNINTVAGSNSNINVVAGLSSAIATVNSNSTNINNVSSNSTNINTVAGSDTSITSVAGSIANVNTVASNLTNVNAFADTYFIGSTAPSSPTAGDLWFDTSVGVDTMKVYGASGWQNAGSSVNGTSQRVSYTATAGQTSFAATYDAGYVDVYLNGIKLISGTDFTATSGTSVVLASGAAVNDTVDIVAYGTFSISNFSINDANDVAASGATNGQFLQYNGSNWVGGTVSTPTLSSLSIANHDQVTVTAGGAVTATSYAGDGSALTGVEAFASGTKMLFGQTAAPTGWTKITTDDDAALRIVSGTVGSGGSSGLSTALATPAVTGTIAGSTGAHTLTSAEIPSHQHALKAHAYQSNAANTVRAMAADGYRNNTVTRQTSEGYGSDAHGGSGSHSHSLSATFSGGTATINVKYVDVIMASKD